MINKLSITVLMDNRSLNAQLKTEHGLSLWIEADGFTILFDTGQSDKLIHNANELGVNLSSADAMILSHGHYDHTGGICNLLQNNRSTTIYGHSEILKPRFRRLSDGSMKSLGMPNDAVILLKNINERMHWINGPCTINNSIGISGPVPRKTDFEDTGGPFFNDRNGLDEDLITDDLSLWFETKLGVVIVCGCCHSGIINTIRYINILNRYKQMHSIIGGLHLQGASDKRLNKTIESLQSCQLKKMVPLHCTGDNVTGLLQQRLGDMVSYGYVGMCLVY